MARSGCAYPDMYSTGTPGRSARTCPATSLPSICGMTASVSSLHDVAGASLWLSLALGSIPPAIRAVAGFAAGRTANLLALLMLAVNLAGIVVSFLTGDPRP